MRREHSRRSVLHAIKAGLIGSVVARFAGASAEALVGGTTRFDDSGLPLSTNAQPVCDHSHTNMDKFTQQCRELDDPQIPQLPSLPEGLPELPNIPEPSNETRVILIDPALEEALFRGAFSFATNIIEGRREPFMDAIAGSGDAKITPTDALGSIVSSVAFGLAHNLGNERKGIQKIEPHAFEAAGGMVFWSLARNYGLLSSYIAHSTFNATSTLFRRILR